MITQLLLSGIILIIGFVVLIKGGGWLVDGSASIAKKFSISNLVIGLTIVSFGTSAPELIVNILASINNSADLAIGNVVGSNLSNILLILGITAIVYPLNVQKGTTWKEVPFSLLAVVVLGFIVNDALIDKVGYSAITRIDGVILLLFFIIFMYYTFGISKAEGEEGEEVKQYTNFKSILFIVIGIIGLAIGGQLVVDNAIKMASLLGVGDAIIGLTIVAIGTSLPELVTSVTAALRKNADIAVGNVVGSNIFNVVWILGLSSVIRPIHFSSMLNFDVVFLIGITLILFLYMFVGIKQKLERWQGISFVTLYVLYIIFLVVRELA